jgi:ATP-dependent Clp protease ATP-binding subunit ClpB
MLEQNNVKLKVTEPAIELLAREGYDPDFGARPVKRAIQRLLLNDLSKAMLGGTLQQNIPIEVDVQENHLTFRNAIG